MILPISVGLVGLAQFKDSIHINWPRPKLVSPILTTHSAKRAALAFRLPICCETFFNSTRPSRTRVPTWRTLTALVISSWALATASRINSTVCSTRTRLPTLWTTQLLSPKVTGIPRSRISCITAWIGSVLRIKLNFLNILWLVSSLLIIFLLLLCKRFNQVLGSQLSSLYGNITAENSIRYVTPIVQSGSLLTIYYDFPNDYVFIANARSENETGPSNAFDRYEKIFFFII